MHRRATAARGDKPQAATKRLSPKRFAMGGASNRIALPAYSVFSVAARYAILMARPCVRASVDAERDNEPLDEA